MKIKGEFILREMAGDKILVPVGQTALEFNGIIILQPVAALIWEGLLEGLSKEQFANRMKLQKIMLDSGFRPLNTEWWHFTLNNEPYPDTYFDFVIE